MKCYFNYCDKPAKYKVPVSVRIPLIKENSSYPEYGANEYNYQPVCEYHTLYTNWTNDALCRIEFLDENENQ